MPARRPLSGRPTHLAKQPEECLILQLELQAPHKMPRPPEKLRPKHPQLGGKATQESTKDWWRDQSACRRPQSRAADRKGTH